MAPKKWLEEKIKKEQRKWRRADDLHANGFHHQSVFKTVPVRLPGLLSKYVLRFGVGLVITNNVRWLPSSYATEQRLSRPLTVNSGNNFWSLHQSMPSRMCKDLGLEALDRNDLSSSFLSPLALLVIIYLNLHTTSLLIVAIILQTDISVIQCNQILEKNKKELQTWISFSVVQRPWDGFTGRSSEDESIRWPQTTAVPPCRSWYLDFSFLFRILSRKIQLSRSRSSFHWFP